MGGQKVAPNPCRACGGPKNKGDGLHCQRCQKKKATKQKASARAHAKRIEETYGITADEYAALLDYQGGACAICRRAPRAKRLAVDHAHDLEHDGQATRESVRGLLCRNCNRNVLGHLQDDPSALSRAIDYLKQPPARKVLKN